MATLCRIAPELPVSNVKDAILYYSQKLGFQVAMELPTGDYAIVERNGIAIHLFKDDPRLTGTVAVHIFTHELDELHKELSKRGATISQGIVRKPWGNRDFRVSDCAGNILKFTEPLPAEFGAS